MFNDLFQNCAVYEITWKNIVELNRLQMTSGLRTLHAGYLRLQTQTQSVYYFLLFHCNDGCTNAPHCYIICILPLLFSQIGRAHV
jgi:hypothetical protein